LKINEEINAPELLLIDEDGSSLGKVSRDQAMYLAFEKEVDLVLLNPNSDPPAAKLMDYGKYIYNQTKQVSKQKSQAKTSTLKEVRFSIKIDEHDLMVKTNKVKKFLEQGDKVKVTVILKGREMMFQDRASGLVDKVKVGANANLEKGIERAGNRFSAIMVKNK